MRHPIVDLGAWVELGCPWPGVNACWRRAEALLVTGADRGVAVAVLRQAGRWRLLYRRPGPAPA